MPLQPKLSMDDAVVLVYEIRKTKYKRALADLKAELLQCALRDWQPKLDTHISNAQIQDADSVE